MTASDEQTPATDGILNTFNSASSAYQYWSSATENTYQWIEVIFEIIPYMIQAAVATKFISLLDTVTHVSAAVAGNVYSKKKTQPDLFLCIRCCHEKQIFFFLTLKVLYILNLSGFTRVLQVMLFPEEIQIIILCSRYSCNYPHFCMFFLKKTPIHRPNSCIDIGKMIRICFCPGELMLNSFWQYLHIIPAD